MDKDCTNFDMCDLFKFIFSLMIFTMHLNAFSDVSYLIKIIFEWITRLGMPFFMIMSSFFLFRKVTGQYSDKVVIRKYIIRILKLYIIWFLINSPSIFYTRIYKMDMSSIQMYLHFFKMILLSSSFTGSWFLVTCLFSSLLIYVLSKSFDDKQILWITFPIFLCCASTSGYAGFFPEAYICFMKKQFMFPLNIFTGCFYFAIGKYLADRIHQIPQVLKKYSRQFFIIFELLSLIELFLLLHLDVMDSSDIFLCNIPAVFFLCISIIGDNRRINKAQFLRRLSTIIYCSQGNIICLSNIFRENMFLENSLLNYIMCCFIELIIIILVLYTEKLIRIFEGRKRLTHGNS